MGERVVDAAKYAEALRSELRQLRALAEAMGSARRAFQTLPRALRRRMMSHHPERLPRRLRAAAAREDERAASAPPRRAPPPAPAAGSARAARPAAPARRRVRRGLVRAWAHGADRGPRRAAWLPTHTWHARRAHMTALEVEPPGGGPARRVRVAAARADRGLRAAHRHAAEACTAHDASYATLLRVRGPAGAVAAWLGRAALPAPGRAADAAAAGAPVRVLPGPAAAAAVLVVHPAAAADVARAARAAGLAADDLSPALALLEVRGPLAHRTLQLLLRPADPAGADAASWAALAAVRSCAELPPRAALALSVADPRWHACASFLRRAARAPPAADPLDALPLVARWPRCDAARDFWAAAAAAPPPRGAAADAAAAAVAALLAGDPPPPRAGVPVLLVQHPPNRARGFGSGWDVILPRAWARPLWLALVDAGAFFLGLAERRQLALEAGLRHFPEDYPDSNAYARWLAAASRARRDRHARTPSARRPNYAALRCPHPFAPDWDAVAAPRTPYALRPLGPGRPDWNAAVHAPAPADGPPRAASRPRADDGRDAERPLLGFVTSGGYSLLHGAGLAVCVCGPAAAPGGAVLVRPPTSLRYFWARLAPIS
jgi:ribonuclease P/MRP protein subunit POP1